MAKEMEAFRRLFLNLIAALFLIGPPSVEARPRLWNKEIPTATIASPMTTSLPEAQPTVFALDQWIVEQRLGQFKKRQAPGSYYPYTVCGFIGGKGDVPALCSSQSVCVWDTARAVVGCSNTVNSFKAIYTTCYDINNRDERVDSPWAYTCAGDDECYENTYEAVSGTDYYQWGCGRSGYATTVLYSPTDGTEKKSVYIWTPPVNLPDPSTSSEEETSTTSEEETSTTEEPETSTIEEPEKPSVSHFEEDSSTLIPPSRTPSPTSSSRSPGSQTTSAGGTTATPVPDNNTNNGSPINVGAIAGGAAGGAVLLMALIGLLFFLWRRKKRTPPQFLDQTPAIGGLPPSGGKPIPPSDPMMAEQYGGYRGVAPVPVPAWKETENTNGPIEIDGRQSPYPPQRWSELSGETISQNQRGNQMAEVVELPGHEAVYMPPPGMRGGR